MIDGDVLAAHVERTANRASVHKAAFAGESMVVDGEFRHVVAAVRISKRRSHLKADVWCLWGAAQMLLPEHLVHWLATFVCGKCACGAIGRPHAILPLRIPALRRPTAMDAVDEDAPFWTRIRRRWGRGWRDWGTKLLGEWRGSWLAREMATGACGEGHGWCSRVLRRRWPRK